MVRKHRHDGGGQLETRTSFTELSFFSTDCMLMKTLRVNSLFVCRSRHSVKAMNEFE